MPLQKQTPSPTYKGVYGALSRQLMALAAPSYTVTVRDPLTGRAFADHGMTPDAIDQKIPRLIRKNQGGDDVYITPESDDTFYIVIDDVRRPEDVYQYGPCYLQETSVMNWQAVLKLRAPVVMHDATWRAVTAVAGELNRRHGDAKVSNPRQPFRAAGFQNKKPGRNDFCVEVFLCEPYVYASGIVEEMILTAQAKLTRDAGPAATVQTLDAVDMAQAAATFDRTRAMILGRCRVCGWDVDPSRVDWQTAQAMHRAGYPEDVVRQLMIERTDVAARHRDVDGYIRLTLGKIY